MGTFAKLMSSTGTTMKAQIEELTGEEVVAVGQLRQGKTPSMVAMFTGVALIEVLRPRRSKSLPRAFALAVTANRVVAFACTGGSDEDGDNYHVVVRGKERGSWPLGSVTFEGLAKDQDGTLNLAGELIPVCRPNMNGDPETDALFALIGRGPAAPDLAAAPAALENVQ